MIARLADRKRFCIAAFLLSVLPLAAIPCSAGRAGCPRRLVAGGADSALVSASSAAIPGHGGPVVVAGRRGADANPRAVLRMAAAVDHGRHRGRRRHRRNGHRQRPRPNQLHARDQSRRCPRGFPTASSLGLGAVFLLAALGAAVANAGVPSASQPVPRAIARRGRPAKLDNDLSATPAFCGCLVFGCWFSFFNGITQSAQNYYPMHVLGISLFLSLSLQTGMNLGQWTVSPWLGRLADRLGNRPVMFVCQLLVAAGLLFFAAATPAHWGGSSAPGCCGSPTRA